MKPGESGKVVLVVDHNPKSNYDLASIELLASNSGDVSGAPDANANCGGVVTGYGPVGNVLWRWHATEYYEYYGTFVVWSNVQTRDEEYWGWQFAGSDYSNQGNYGQVFSSGSIGYFTGPSGQHKYGRLGFTIYANGYCSVSGTSGDW